MRILRIAILLILTVAVISATAQHTVIVAAQDHDLVKITLAYQNLNVANQNLPGGNLSVDFKLGGYGKWRLGAVADGAYHYDTNRALDRYQFLGGPQLSYALGERVSIFGRGLFGVTRFDQRSSCQRDFARATVSIGGGIDVNISDHFYLRPLQGDVQYIDERAARYTRLGAGAGFRF